jgi:hypothetical protein
MYLFLNILSGTIIEDRNVESNAKRPKVHSMLGNQSIHPTTKNSQLLTMTTYGGILSLLSVNPLVDE